MKIRYLQTASRSVSPEEVFAQLAFAVELARSEPRVVGINLVAPEDSRVSLQVTEACAHDPTGAANPSRACAEFLASSERAPEQWRLEAEFAAFEKLSWLP